MTASEAVTTRQVSAEPLASVSNSQPAGRAWAARREFDILATGSVRSGSLHTLGRSLWPRDEGAVNRNEEGREEPLGLPSQGGVQAPRVVTKLPSSCQLEGGRLGLSAFEERADITAWSWGPCPLIQEPPGEQGEALRGAHGLCSQEEEETQAQPAGPSQGHAVPIPQLAGFTKQPRWQASCLPCHPGNGNNPERNVARLRTGPTDSKVQAGCFRSFSLSKKKEKGTKMKSCSSLSSG